MVKHISVSNAFYSIITKIPVQGSHEMLTQALSQIQENDWDKEGENTAD